MSVRSEADIARIRTSLDAHLATLGHKVYAIVNYDRFDILPELADAYAAMVRAIVDRYYHDVTRYTGSAFLRVKLGRAFAGRQLAPQLYASAAEAQGGLAGG
jgi:propionate CoA-transferase